MLCKMGTLFDGQFPHANQFIFINVTTQKTPITK